MKEQVNIKTEFVDTIRGALDKYAEGQPNMASEAARGEIAESVEQEIRSKFHIFRINRILKTATPPLQHRSSTSLEVP